MSKWREDRGKHQVWIARVRRPGQRPRPQIASFCANVVTHGRRFWSEARTTRESKPGGSGPRALHAICRAPICCQPAETCRATNYQTSIKGSRMTMDTNCVRDKYPRACHPKKNPISCFLARIFNHTASDQHLQNLLVRMPYG